jgi:hypothetical protein
VEICGCETNSGFFDLVCLSISGSNCTALNGKTYASLAGGLTFPLDVVIQGSAFGSIVNYFAASATTCALTAQGTLSGGGGSTDLIGNGATAIIDCGPPFSVTWGLGGSALCGQVSISGTAVLTTDCALQPDSGPCSGVDAPNAPVATISGAVAAGLDGSYQLIAMFGLGGAGEIGLFSNWETYPVGVGHDFGNGHRMIMTLAFDGTMAVTIYRTSDGHSVTGTGGAIDSCAPFSATATITLTGSDATVFGYGETITMAVSE